MTLRDLDAETRLIGILMIRPALWPELAQKFSPRLFSDPEHQAVASVLQKEASLQNGFSPTRILRQLGAEMKGGVQRIVDMTDRVITTEEATGLVDLLHELSARRAVLQVMHTHRKALEDLDTPLTQTVGQIQSDMLNACATLGHDGSKTWDELLEINHRNLIERQEGKAEYVWPVGLRELAKYMKGIRRKHLIILAARPSMGKTTFAQFLAVHLAKRGVASYFFCPDQAADEISERELWNQSGIRSEAWEHPQRWSPAEWDAANSAFHDLRGLPITINDRRGMTPLQIAAVARREKAINPKLGMIVIDYLQALPLTHGDRRMSWPKLVGEACRQFKDLAEELDVAVLLLSQLNRGVESRDDKRPTLADLRDSGEIEEHANEVLFLYREAYYQPDLAEQLGQDRVCEIHIAKQKQGPRGKVAFVRYEPEYARFRDLTDGEFQRYVQSLQGHAS